tara:strand:- start:1369 stop:1758 length:390 start_codon:yes stop_codon:yes gene_type:complete
MARGEKVCCDGKWTQARFNQFIKNLIRAGHMRNWGPKQTALKLARDGKINNPETNRLNIASKCNICLDRFLEADMKTDHIYPVIDPHKGFTTWDECIKRMYVEVDGYQILCKQCHDKKTKEETAIRYRK